MSRSAKKRKRTDDLNESEFQISPKRRFIGVQVPILAHISGTRHNDLRDERPTQDIQTKLAAIDLSSSDRITQESANLLLREEIQQLYLEGSGNAQKREDFLNDTLNRRVNSSSTSCKMNSSSKELISLPVRYLNDFEIRDAYTRQLITLDNIEDEKRNNSPYFIGAVSSVLEDIDSDCDCQDENSPRRRGILVESSTIIEIWQASEENREVNEENEIWIRTEFAWYILDRPSKKYQTLFFPRWIRHKLLLLAAYLAKRENADVNRFQRKFLKNEARWAEETFGEILDAESLRVHMPEMLRVAIRDGHWVTVTRFFDELCKEYAPHLSGLPPSPTSSRGWSPDGSYRSWSPAGSSEGGHIIGMRRPYLAGHDPRLTETFCSPLILNLVRPYFPSLQTQDSDDSDGENESISSISSVDSLVDLELPGKVKASRKPGILTRIEINGYQLAPGDSVIIRPDGFDASCRQVRVRELPLFVWFGIITQLYNTDEGVPRAHVTWYEPASKTSLKELAHPQELMLLDQCDDIDIAAIIRPLSIKRLAIDEEEPDLQDNECPFFCRYYWKSFDDDTFLDVSQFLPEDTTICPSCQNRTQENATQHQRVENGVRINDTDYHVKDFVYIIPEGDGQVYHIGQIKWLSLTAGKVFVRLFPRSPKIPGQFHDDRLLIALDPTTDLVAFGFERLEGKCQVFNAKDVDPMNLQDDQFYCESKIPLMQCDVCSNIQHVERGHTIYPLNGLDLFSGAGGLSMGFEKQGLINTKWAVEYDESAVMTFKEIHPNTIVYNACINDILRRANDEEDELDPVVSLQTGEELPPFPTRGEVDIVFGGPPCQGFTRLNHWPKADDPRNRLILSFLSTVDLLRPKYVVLENVRGLLTFRLGARQAGLNKIEGGIERGFVKLVLRLLTAMNYQVRYGILLAGHYGVPQNRRRVIFLAARRDVSLPQLPQPTHVSLQNDYLNVTVSEGDDHRFTVSRRSQRAAPLGPVTIADAIGDLPEWEWINPHTLCRVSNEQKEEEARRRKEIMAIPGDYKPATLEIHVSGPKDPTVYKTKPLNRFQLGIRGDLPRVSQHYSPTFHGEEIERICSVPLNPVHGRRLPDHNDLPEALRRPYMFENPDYKGCYGRLDGNGQFVTAIGRLMPSLTTGRILHPHLRRVLTVREAARSQGFPDHVIFHSTSKSIRKLTQQIGNAVPLPMAAAIAKEISRSIVKHRMETDPIG
ncbi:S-adenosyl-L-methionine-dependent methyltransferase [Serendipita vermifera]|nr:S-adenosyl-L-methionine-dependent methyltransferase [Serendipita vermifera]